MSWREKNVFGEDYIVGEGNIVSKCKTYCGGECFKQGGMSLVGGISLAGRTSSVGGMSLAVGLSLEGECLCQERNVFVERATSSARGNHFQ